MIELTYDDLDNFGYALNNTQSAVTELAGIMRSAYPDNYETFSARDMNDAIAHANLIKVYAEGVIRELNKIAQKIEIAEETAALSTLLQPVGTWVEGLR